MTTLKKYIYNFLLKKGDTYKIHLTEENAIEIFCIELVINKIWYEINSHADIYFKYLFLNKIDNQKSYDILHTNIDKIFTCIFDNDMNNQLHIKNQTQEILYNSVLNYMYSESDMMYLLNCKIDDDDTWDFIFKNNNILDGFKYILHKIFFTLLSLMDEPDSFILCKYKNKNNKLEQHFYDLCDSDIRENIFNILDIKDIEKECFGVSDTQQNYNNTGDFITYYFNFQNNLENNIEYYDDDDIKKELMIYESEFDWYNNMFTHYKKEFLEKHPYMLDNYDKKLLKHLLSNKQERHKYINTFYNIVIKYNNSMIKSRQEHLSKSVGIFKSRIEQYNIEQKSTTINIFSKRLGIFKNLLDNVLNAEQIDDILSKELPIISKLLGDFKSDLEQTNNYLSKDVGDFRSIIEQYCIDKQIENIDTKQLNNEIKNILSIQHDLKFLNINDKKDIKKLFNTELKKNDGYYSPTTVSKYTNILHKICLYIDSNIHGLVFCNMKIIQRLYKIKDNDTKDKYMKCIRFLINTLYKNKYLTIDEKNKITYIYENIYNKYIYITKNTEYKRYKIGKTININQRLNAHEREEYKILKYYTLNSSCNLDSIEKSLLDILNTTDNINKIAGNEYFECLLGDEHILKLIENFIENHIGKN